VSKKGLFDRRGNKPRVNGPIKAKPSQETGRKQKNKTSSGTQKRIHIMGAVGKNPIDKCCLVTCPLNMKNPGVRPFDGNKERKIP